MTDTAALTIDPWALATFILAGLLLMASTGLIVQWYRHRHLQTGLQNAVTDNRRLQAACADYARQLEQTASFTADLNQAALAARFQPRLLDHGAIAERTAPERYRYAQRLSEEGMEADQLASLLALSRHEAEQLVRLSRISAPS